MTVILTGAAIRGYFYFRNRDERALRALVSELENSAAKRPGKSQALALLDAATPERIFAPQVEITSDIPKMKRSFTLKEIGQTLVAMKKSFSTAKLDITVDSITVHQDTATVTGEAIFSGSSSRGSFRELRQLILGCKKIDGEWKIISVSAEAAIVR